MQRRSVVAAVGVVVFLLVAVIGAEAAEVKVLSAVGMRQVMLDLGPKFERSTGHTLSISYESSGVIVPRVEAGETADVLMLPRSGIDRLMKAGKVEAGTEADLANAIVGVAVRKGAPKPDISSPEAFKRALLAAKSIARADPAQGGSSAVHIAKVAERLGISDEVKSKSVITFRAQDPLAAPGYTVANGRAEIALHQIQELMSVPGIEIVGPLPGDLQQTFFFSAGIMTGAKEAEAGMALIKFLRTPAAAAVIKAKGMEPAAP